MIQTLKSELKLRPTYDELVGMIESQGDPNRPSITEAIDRKATIFRNNQFGSQFDNLDFLGLKKQEEDKVKNVKNEMRQAQLRQTAIATGSSMGVLTGSSGSRGFTTPFVNTPSSESCLGHLDVERIQAELAEEERRQQQAQQATSSTTRSDLDEAHRQSLPTGIDLSQPASSSQPATIPAQQPEDSSEEELIPADDTAGSTRSFQKAIQYWNNDIDEIRQNHNGTYEDLMFQLHARGQCLKTFNKE